MSSIPEVHSQEKDRILPENFNATINREFIDSLFYRPGYPQFPLKYEKQQQKIIDLILQVRKWDPFYQYYIDLVLKSPHFSLALSKDMIKSTGRYWGVEHGIEFAPFNSQMSKPVMIEEGTLQRTIVHEFWHAFKAISFSPNYYPLYPITPDKPVFPVNAEKLAEMQEAIAIGDRRLLLTAKNLLDEEETLNSKQRDQLNQFKEAAKSYRQKRYDMGLPPSENTRRLMEAIRLGEFMAVPYQSPSNGVFHILYLNTFVGQIDNGLLQFSGLSVQNENDKLLGMIHEIIWRQQRMESNYKSLNRYKFPLYSYCKEHDAHIIEGIDIKALRVFYPELLGIHKNDSVENAIRLRHPENLSHIITIFEDNKPLATKDIKNMTPVLQENSLQQSNVRASLYALTTGAVSFFSPPPALTSEQNQNDDFIEIPESPILDQSLTPIVIYTTIAAGAIIAVLLYYLYTLLNQQSSRNTSQKGQDKKSQALCP